MLRSGELWVTQSKKFSSYEIGAHRFCPSTFRTLVRLLSSFGWTTKLKRLHLLDSHEKQQKRARVRPMVHAVAKRSSKKLEFDPRPRSTHEMSSRGIGSGGSAHIRLLLRCSPHIYITSSVALFRRTWSKAAGSEIRTLWALAGRDAVRAGEICF